MENVRAMKTKEIEKEVVSNRCSLRTASLAERRALISRNHELKMELDRRYAVAEKTLLDSLKK